MIQPNFDLMLWFILISWILKAICRIGLGAAGKTKETKFYAGDVGIGIITLIFALIIAFA